MNKATTQLRLLLGNVVTGIIGILAAERKANIFL